METQSSIPHKERIFGFTLRQPAALNQRVLQREDVRLRGVGRGAVLIFGLVAAEHVFHVLRLRVTGFAGVVDQHDPVLVFGDLAEAHVFAHAPLDDGVVTSALIDVGLIGDDLDQNRLVERGQKCMISAFLWAMLSWLYLRKKQEGSEAVTGFGGLVYSEVDQRFYTAAHTPIRFTPMQQQLMLLFWNAPSHSLTKEDICAALWPKKEDANDTLYTLIRRLKPIVEEHTNLKIVADRGRNYSLEINKI